MSNLLLQKSNKVWPLRGSTRQELPRLSQNPLKSVVQKFVPIEQSCFLFCKGKKCRYCNPSGLEINSGPQWSSKYVAIPGLYCNWITKDILATSRPTTKSINCFSIIEHFKTKGIKSVFNLQQIGEHSSCGFGNESNGLSYDPEIFMKDHINYYHFPWPDYGASHPHSLLDIIKVLQFALTQGKVAIHCHAGLGRTGVLIAAYLMLTERKTANEAIDFVRENRPKAVQTRRQLQCLVEFEALLKPLWVVFSSVKTIVQSDYASSFTLSQYLRRQRLLLHGEEAKDLKNIPKILYTLCQHLLNLIKTKSNRDCICEFIGEISKSHYTCDQEIKLIEHKTALNQVDIIYSSLEKEDDLAVVAGLIWDWLDGLLDPILTAQDIISIVKIVRIEKEGSCSSFAALEPLSKDTKGTVVFLFKSIASFLNKRCNGLEVIQRALSTLTHCNIKYTSEEASSSPQFPLTVNVRTIDENSGYLLLRLFNQLVAKLQSFSNI